MKKIYVSGLSGIQAKLKKYAKHLEDDAKPILVRVVAKVQKESMKRTPIQYGVLRASHRSTVSRGFGGWVGKVYLLAAYALFVHEAPEGTNFRSEWPRGRKFLERAITDNLKEIKQIISNGYIK